jgi:hypothetical protein
MDIEDISQLVIFGLDVDDVQEVGEHADLDQIA